MIEIMPFFNPTWEITIWRATMTTNKAPAVTTGSTTQLIAISDPRSAAAEAYRTLRTNIQFSGLDRKLHTLLVTSTTPDEGKSITLANLAVTMAQGEQKVLLVDCDLRRPSLHTLFGLHNEQGLTSM